MEGLVRLAAGPALVLCREQSPKSLDAPLGALGFLDSKTGFAPLGASVLMVVSRGFRCRGLAGLPRWAPPSRLIESKTRLREVRLRPPSQVYPSKGLFYSHSH